MLPVMDHAVLHKPVINGATEDFQEVRAIIMIAKHQMNRKREFFQALLKCHIGLNVPTFRQVTGNGAKFRIPVILNNIGKALVEAHERIKPPQFLVWGHKMKISEMDEFHAGFLASLLNRDPRSNPAASTMG